MCRPYPLGCIVVYINSCLLSCIAFRTIAIVGRAKNIKRDMKDSSKEDNNIIKSNSAVNIDSTFTIKHLWDTNNIFTVICESVSNVRVQNVKPLSVVRSRVSTRCLQTTM